VNLNAYIHFLLYFVMNSVTSRSNRSQTPPVHRFVRPAIIGHLYLLYLYCPPNSYLWQILNYTIPTSHLFRTSVSIARRYVRRTFRSWYHASSMQISVTDSTDSSRPVARYSHTATQRPVTRIGQTPTLGEGLVPRPYVQACLRPQRKRKAVYAVQS